MQAPRLRAGSGLTVQKKQLVFAVPIDEDGREEMRYFTEDAAQDNLARDEEIRQALSVIGAWSDLGWNHAVEELDRIRHESRPTPSIECT